MKANQSTARIAERLHLSYGPSEHISDAGKFSGATFQVFAPFQCDDTNINNRSLVVVASYASSKIVIPGDNEALSCAKMPAFRLSNSA